LLNLSALGAEAGISHTTARHWLSVLRASYIVTVLAPHHESFNKHLVKSPKLYFLDTGLLCALPGTRTAADLWDHPLRGAIFETFVVAELQKLFVHNGERPRLFFWRDSHGVEVDVLIGQGRTVAPVEIKAGATVAADALRGLENYVRLRSAAERSAPERSAAERSKPGRQSTSGDSGSVLVYGGDERYERRGHDVRPWWACT